MQDQDRREYTATFREMQDKNNYLNTKYNSADEACVFTLYVIFQGIWTSIAKKHYSFVIFQGGGPAPCPYPPLDPRMSMLVVLGHVFQIMIFQVMTRYLNIDVWKACAWIYCILLSTHNISYFVTLLPVEV